MIRVRNSLIEQINLNDKYSKYKEILMNNNRLFVAKSNINNAGNGLFTLKKLKKNEIITFVDGYFTDRPNIFDMNLHSHCITINRYVIIDGFRRNKYNIGYGSFINDIRNQSLYNVKFEKITLNNLHTYIFIKAIKDIDENEELYLNYGNGYWDNYIT